MSSERPSAHEDLSLKLRASPKVWGVLGAILLAVFGSGGVAWRMGEATREQSEVATRIAQQQVDNALLEQQLLRERICVLEHELVAEVTARVSLSQADAEPVRAKKAQSAAEAVTRFTSDSRDWACPSSAEDRERRNRRPLAQRALSSISTRPPGR